MDQPGHVHVVPLNDFREHELSVGCWCRPAQEEETAELYVHNAMDGREAFERGERQPS